MKKIITFMVMFLGLHSVLFSQPQTVKNTVVAGGTDPTTGTYVAIGQPFYQQYNSGAYEVAYSVAQAQLDQLEVADETCVNVPYTDNGFDIPASILSVGSSNYELYSNNVDPYGYDRFTKLVLTVWPTFETEVSEMYHGSLPLIDGSELQDGVDYQVVEGDNVINYKSIHGCDSVVTLHASLCPLTVKDADSNLYNTLVLDQFCWTQSNLKTTHYFGDDHREVANALVYQTVQNSDAVANENTFGRLYTWFSAVDVPEGSASIPVLDDDGFVRGVCPAGWHLPALPEKNALDTHTGAELRTYEYWILGAGVNSSGFSLLPAGIYQASVADFIGLLTMTRMWYVSSTPGEPVAICTEYYCDTFLPEPVVSPYDAYSVRCVKNY